MCPAARRSRGRPALRPEWPGPHTFELFASWPSANRKWQEVSERSKETAASKPSRERRTGWHSSCGQRRWGRCIVKSQIPEVHAKAAEVAKELLLTAFFAT